MHKNETKPMTKRSRVGDELCSSSSQWGDNQSEAEMGRRRAESERSGEAGRVASRPEMGNHNKYASLMRILS